MANFKKGFILLVLGTVLFALIPIGRYFAPVLAQGQPTETPAPQGTFNPTFTATATATGTLKATATPVVRTSTRVPTATGTAFPTDTRTPAPLVVPQSTTVPTGPLVAQEVSLLSLGVRPIELVSPQGTAQFTFRVPDNWQVGGTNTLNLAIDYVESGATNSTGVSTLTSIVRVRLDGQALTTLTLGQANVGSRIVPVALPVTVLNNTLRRVHTVQLTLDAKDQCLSNSEVRLSARNDLSYFHLEYRQTGPVLDLGLYPRPIYNSPLPGQVESPILVLPAKYTTADLDATASISAGLGQLTGNNIRLRVKTADVLSEDDQKANTLILIGQVGTNAALDALYAANLLPTTFAAGKGLSLKTTPIATTDGVIQVIVNPKNPLRAILVITGQTADAVAKASKALAGPPSMLGLGGALALVADVHPPVQLAGNEASVTRLSFASLGYPNATVSGLGPHQVDVKFTVPLGMELSNDAAVDLHFDYSDLLNQTQTTLTLSVNDTPISSLLLGKASAVANPTLAPQHWKVTIPPGTVHPGDSNILTLSMDVQGDWNCNPPNTLAAWLTVYGDSELYLPQQRANPSNISPLLSWFPSPFNAVPDLHNTWISLSDKATLTEIEQALQLVVRLGAETTAGQRFAPRIGLGALPASEDPAAYHLIAFGRPSTNSLIAALNPNLPQPFKAGSDDLMQVLDTVTYRLPPGFDLGILQTLKSPWSPDKLILVITGTTAVGQTNAINVLIGGKYAAADLVGDVVFAQAANIYVVNSSQVRPPSAAPTATPTALPATAVPAEPTVSPSSSPSPAPVFTITPISTAVSALQ